MQASEPGCLLARDITDSKTMYLCSSEAFSPLHNSWNSHRAASRGAPRLWGVRFRSQSAVKSFRLSVAWEQEGNMFQPHLLHNTQRYGLFSIRILLYASVPLKNLQADAHKKTSCHIHTDRRRRNSTQNNSLRLYKLRVVDRK
jgi:hypothetical protein